MKNLICFLLFFSFPTAIIAMTISGKITNLENKQLKLYGVSSENEIKVKPDGTFSATFEIPHDGTYILMTANNRLLIYLNKNSVISFTADEKDFLKTILFKGDNAKENQYWIEKEKLSQAIGSREFYTLDEQLFLEKHNEIAESIVALYKKTPFENKQFKELEARNLKFTTAVNFRRYENWHAGMIKNDNFKVSDSFPKPDPAFDGDNEADYLFSMDYRDLVSYEFNRRQNAPDAPTETAASKLPFALLKTYESNVIRNQIMQGFMYFVNIGNPDAEKVYNDLMTNLTDVAQKKQLTEKFQHLKALFPGNISAGFDYENVKGGKTSLESLKGKYVYIDVWATWCGPCREEIPSLQRVESQYHGKNIAFVSISLDQKKDFLKWKQMVEDKKLSGIQLIADKDFNSEFVKEYAIEGIPRFIFIDPNGKIINADAPRPSDPELLNLFGSLKI